jgi:hypothetical protein
MAAVLFRLPRTRHPLLRALSVVLGLAVIGVTLVFGFFLVLGLAAVGATIWAVRQLGRSPAGNAAAPPPRPTPVGVIEGEFVVVREPVTPAR